MKKPNIIIINEKDNVGVALHDIKKGESIRLPRQGQEITAATDIPYSHKVALKGFKKGDQVIKYGEVIGIASMDIEKGEWIHTHNIDTEGI